MALQIWNAYSSYLQPQEDIACRENPLTFQGMTGWERASVMTVYNLFWDTTEIVRFFSRQVGQSLYDFIEEEVHGFPPSLWETPGGFTFLSETSGLAQDACDESCTCMDRHTVEVDEKEPVCPLKEVD